MTPDQFMRQYEAATCAHDLSATLALIADDAVYFFSDRTTHVGKPAIQLVLEQNFASISGENYRIEGLRWLATCDQVAACVYDYSWSGVINGQPASGQGQGTSVIRANAGSWLVVHEHLSPGRLQPAVTEAIAQSKRSG
jgi:ketosteroid isomerase-like protein